MKKKILLVLSSLLILNTPLVFAEESKEVTELKSQIEMKTKELEELKTKLKELTGQESDGYTDWYEANGLKMKFSMSIVPSFEVEGGTYEPKKDVYLMVKIKYATSKDEIATIDSDNFNLYLADVEYPGTHLLGGTSLDKEAVPPGVELENQFFYDLPKHIAEAKGLTLKFEPSDTIFRGETLFELDVQKIIEQSKEVSEKKIENKENHSQTSNASDSTTPKPTASSNGEAQVYKPGLNGYNPQGSATPPLDWAPPQFSTYEEERMHYAENEIIVHEVDIAEGTDSDFFQLAPETVNQIQYVDEAK